MKKLTNLLFLTIIFSKLLGAFFLPQSCWALDHQVKIGVILPLSGSMATLGGAIRNGIELARSERPELFGRIKFIYEDDQYDIKQSIAAYRKLRDLDNISLLFGFGATLGLVLGPTTDQENIPLINFNFDATPAIGRKLLIRSMNHTRQYMQALANYYQSEGIVEFNIVQAESLFFNSMVSSFQESAGDGGVVDILERYNPSETDFRAVIIRLKAMPASQRSRPIGLFLTPEQILEFLRQAQELNYKGSYFGTDLFETAAAIASDKSNLQGCIYPDNEVTDHFRLRYREVYGNEAQITFAASAYEMTLLLGERVSSLQIFDSSTLLSNLEKVNKRSSELGEYSFVRDSELGMFFEFPVRVKRMALSIGVPVE